MWWRAAVAAIALTYILCVLLLSGMQKEEWGAAVMEKLQRRNENIDVNDEIITEKCREMTNVRTKATPLPSTNKTISTLSDFNEEKRQMHILKNSFNKTKKQSSQNIYIPDTGTAKNEESTRIVFENTQASTQTTTSTTTTPVSVNKDNQNTYNNVEYINSMILRYLEAELTTKIQPSTTTERTTIPELYIDLISHKIKGLLVESHKKSVTKLISEIIIHEKVERTTTTPNIASNFDNEHTKISNDMRKYNKDSSQKDDATKTIKRIPDIVENIETEAIISDDIIKEITEKITASVLKELRSHLNSSKFIETTSTGPMISSSPVSSTSIPKSDTNITVSVNVIDNLIELLKQIKEEREFATKNSYALAQNKESWNEFHGPINVLYPPLLPLKYDHESKKGSINSTPILAYPYHHFSIVNNPVLLKNNLPVNPLETENKEALTNFNLGPIHHDNNIKKLSIRPPWTVQSEAGLVPLVIPYSMNPVSQNIVVTTNRLMMTKDRHNYTHTSKHREQNKSEIDAFYDTIRNNRKKHIPIRYLHRDDETEKIEKFVPRNRQYNHDDYFKMLNNLNKDDDGHYHSLDQVPNRDRFHEILAKPEQWQTIVSHEKEPMRLMVSPRQQTSLHDLKRSKYGSHFKDLLKSQKKVNAMLERLLATKSGADDIPSVEVP